MVSNACTLVKLSHMIIMMVSKVTQDNYESQQVLHDNYDG